jgi:hypothetical protein
MLDVMSFAAPEQANALVAPHVPFIVQLLSDPVAVRVDSRRPYTQLIVMYPLHAR